MKQEKQILKAAKITSIPEKTQERIAAVAKDIQGKELFSAKVELAKKTLSNLKSLPI